MPNSHWPSWPLSVWPSVWPFGVVKNLWPQQNDNHTFGQNLILAAAKFQHYKISFDMRYIWQSREQSLKFPIFDFLIFFLCLYCSHFSINRLGGTNSCITLFKILVEQRSLIRYYKVNYYITVF